MRAYTSKMTFRLSVAYEKNSLEIEMRQPWGAGEEERGAGRVSADGPPDPARLILGTQPHILTQHRPQQPQRQQPSQNGEYPPRQGLPPPAVLAVPAVAEDRRRPGRRQRHGVDGQDHHRGA